MKVKVKCGNCKNLFTVTIKGKAQKQDKATVKCKKCNSMVSFKIPKGDVTQIPLDMPKIYGIVLINTKNAKEYKLKEGENILGRSKKEADICIDANDRKMSRKHCVVSVVKKGDLYKAAIKDDGSLREDGRQSTNGTYYNNKKLDKYDDIIVKAGGRIKIGNTELLVKFLSDFNLSADSPTISSGEDKTETE